MIGRMLQRQGWSVWHAVGCVVLVGLAVYLSRDAWLDIYNIASLDPEQSHTFLVPFVSVWMFWARRARFRACPPAGQYIGPVIFGIGWLMSHVGYNHAFQSVWHAGAVMMAVGAAISVLGKNILFSFLPAFVVLVFLVPIPGIIRQSISIPLQNATAFATQAILETVGIAVDRSGNLLTINGNDVAVAEACNGMRMVFALVLVSYAFAYGMPLRNFTRFLVLAGSPIAALLCNVVRLIPTVLLYGYASSTTAKSFHDASGWFMIPIAFALLLGVLRTLRWALVPVTRYTLAYQ